MQGSVVRVGLGGLGTVGHAVARRIAGGLSGYELSAVTARRPERARTLLASLGLRVPVVAVDELADHAEVLVEALPSRLFRALVEPALDRQRTVIVLSAGALLDHWDLVDRAGRRGGVLHLASGAILGLDALQAAALDTIHSVRMVTRKPVTGLVGAPAFDAHGVPAEEVTEPILLFRGTAGEAFAGFPANLNVAIAVSLAGIGPDRTQLEVWADPELSRNTHHIEVEADSARFTLSIENVPSEDNPRTGKLTALSVIALLRKLQDPLRIGT